MLFQVSEADIGRLGMKLNIMQHLFLFGLFKQEGREVQV